MISRANLSPGLCQDTRERIMAKTLLASRPAPHLAVPAASVTTELLGEVAQYESIFLLCYLRRPAGIIVALAEQIG